MPPSQDSVGAAGVTAVGDALTACPGVRHRGAKTKKQKNKNNKKKNPPQIRGEAAAESRRPRPPPPPRLRSQEEATAWFHLHVVAPLSKPEIVGNSSVKAGGNTKLVCNVLQGKADSYWWKKNGQLLLGSERIQFVENTTLCILRASISDSGYYTCVVSNAVSQNETSFLLHVHHSANVVLPVVLACVIIGSLAGIFVWCQRREDECDNCWLFTGAPWRLRTRM
ncbi:PREDICTED: contactin-4-like [Corvus brachyrhynchos]|uniref:contactin-4-like n=1 Tax=Corvus brachyrhynchos TaxID=85066 RepID=UPI000816532A|nr:PREDICTED: contactin-4-like [Corvus brachyrhynchos]